jgi:hypothetical protein
MIDGEFVMSLEHRSVTGGASLADGGAYQVPIQYDEHCDEFVVVRDYDYCLNLRCLSLPAVFASFFYSSFVGFGTCKEGRNN